MTRLTEQAQGVYVIAVTPFKDDGALDFESIDKMVDFYLETGVTGITALGMMGEAPKLTGAESLKVVKRILARLNGRIPMIVGVSAPGFAQMAELSQAVMEAGAGGVMIAPPGSLKTDGQIIAYYHQAAEFIGDTPFVLQDFPLATGVHIPVPVIARIVEEVSTCVCLKHEDWPGLEKITALREEGTLARRISILCGNGGVFLPEEMDRGADGAMTGFCYPEMMRDVVRFSNSGERARARDLFNAYLPLARYEQQPGLGLAVRKYVLAKRGVIASAALRRPGAGLTAAAQAEVNMLLERQDQRLKELN